MREVAAGRLALERPWSSFCPSSRAPIARQVTVRQLLCHSSGLPAHRPFWRQAAEAPSERRAVSLLAAREPLEYPPGTRAVYSDLGFIVLGWLLERLTGERLDVLARKQIAAPLALDATTFMSLLDPDARRARARRALDRGDAAVRRAAPRADRRGRRSERDGDGRHRGPRRAVLDRRGSVARSRRRCAAPGAATTAGGGALVDRGRRADVLVAVGRRRARPGGSGGTGRRRRTRRRGRGSRAPASATSASPAARSGSIPRARPGS